MDYETMVSRILQLREQAIEDLANGGTYPFRKARAAMDILARWDRIVEWVEDLGVKESCMITPRMFEALTYRGHLHRQLLDSLFR